MYTNKVKSVLAKNGKLVLRYFDNSGKIKQKKIDLADTKTNRRKIWKEIVPFFEVELEKRSVEIEMPIDDRLCVYTGKVRNQLVATNHSKEAAHRGRTIAFEKYFGTDRKLSEITELEVEEFFQSLTCKRATKLDWLVALRHVFELARKSKAISQNFLRDFKLPLENLDQEENHVKPFSVKEIEKLLYYSYGTTLHNYLGIAFHIGARPEEVIALKIEDIDFNEMNVSIERAITNGKLKKPKTKASTRLVPLPLQAERFFEAQIAIAKTKGTEFLFSFDDGSRLNEIGDIRGDQRRHGSWQRLLSKAEIPYRKLMQTRHTFAVNAIQSGEYTLQEVATMMGHTSLNMIIHHYGKHLGKSHLKVSRKVDIYGDLGDFLGDFSKKN